MTSLTTYSDLTSDARRHLQAALEETAAPNEAGPLPSAVAMHADVTGALAHLGRVLAAPMPGAAGHATSGWRRGGPPQRLVRELDRVAQPWGWTQEAPEESVTAHLRQSARLIRTAADLWATHQSPTGAPRSLESCRMRHPATLGAATRQWRDLTGLAAAVAQALLDLGDGSRPATASGPATASEAQADTAALDRLRRFPQVDVEPEEGAALVDLTVARPRPSTASHPLVQIAEIVNRVRETTWALAEAGSAPAPVLANTAAIGMLLHGAASQAHLRAAQDVPDGAKGHREAASRHHGSAAQWAEIARQVAALRTAHPPMTALQIERLDLARLLSRASSRRIASDSERVAGELSRSALSFDEVAQFHHRAVGSAQQAADLYVAGRTLTHELLRRRPDLLHAKLADRLVPAPTVVVRRLQDAYRVVGSPAPSSLGTSNSLPAA